MSLYCSVSCRLFLWRFTLYWPRVELAECQDAGRDPGMNEAHNPGNAPRVCHGLAAVFSDDGTFRLLLLAQVTCAVVICARPCLFCSSSLFPFFFLPLRFALLIEGVVLVVIGDDGRKEACRLTPRDHVATVALSAMSILFGLFTCCMAFDQCSVASTNQTKIDRLVPCVLCFPFLTWGGVGWVGFGLCWYELGLIVLSWAVLGCLVRR